MSNDRYFVTGAMGCIGAWVVRALVQEEMPVTVFDLSDNRHRLELVMPADALDKVDFVRGDITHTEAVKSALIDSGASHIIHLAALQVPFCKADPPLGAAVNVVGTVNMFEAAKAAGINHLVFASTAGVYGKKNTYEERLMDHDSRLDPVNHYGVFKQANEGTARIYWQDDGIGSIGLRPYTVYGPGRDQGITSTPTQAMLAAVRGEPYHISFGGYTGFHYVSDVAKLFIQVSQIALKGSEVFNIGGAVAHMSKAVEAIKAVIPEAVVTHEETPLPFPDGLTDEELRALLGDVPDTSLADGIRETIVHFQSAVGDGRLSASS